MRARNAVRTLPPGLRGRVGRATRNLRGELRRQPLVTVVLAVSDQETTQIGPALDTLRAQVHRNLEIVVVPYGAASRVQAVVAKHTGEDWRIRTLKGAAGQAEARDAGAAAAKGDYLHFMAGGDEVLPETISDLVRALEASGSSHAIGLMGTPLVVGPSLTMPSAAAHAREQLGTDLAGVPLAITDLTLGNRLFRTSFWRESRLGFVSSGGTDADIALAAYAVGRTFDLTRTPGYVPTNRRDGVALGRISEPFAELDDWLADQRDTGDRVRALGTEVYDVWLWGVLDSAIQPLLADVERATPEQWTKLRDYAQQILQTTGEHAWSTLRAESRLRLWLTLHDHRRELEHAVSSRWFEKGNRPTTVAGGVVHALLPFHEDAALGVPADTYVMTEDETPLKVVVRGVRWSEPALLHLDLFAYAEYVGFVDTPELEISLVTADGRRSPLEVRQYVDHNLNFLLGHAYQDYSQGAAEATVDAALLDDGDWRLHVVLRHRGIVREGGITSRDLRGTAGLLGSGSLRPRQVGDRLVKVGGDNESDLRIRVGPGTPKAPAPDPVDTLLATRLEYVEGDVVLEGHWLGQAPARFTLAMKGDRATVAAALQPTAGNQVAARFSTAWDEWGLGETRLPMGRYWLTVTVDGRPGRVLLDDGLLARLFEFTIDESFRFRLVQQRREAGVYLLQPLEDHERGAYRQQQLRTWLKEPHEVDAGAVYFQSYNGGSATDTPLAVHQEVRRTRPDLTTYWGIMDRSFAVPDGATPVVMYTREWFEVIATAGHLVMNVDFDRWYHRRPGQKLLQCFHGYPAKAMGISMWESKRFTPQRIEAELARTRDDWDLIVTPTPEMDVFYREQYRYDGEIFNQGYPRNDLLVSADATRVRDETRARLGIAPHQKVVLYAPTWRDDQAVNYKQARAVEYLDAQAASEALGPDYVLLLRGHRFHTKSAVGRSVGEARRIDVTSYPEINHLILAADVAVLDYSSLRFDFALTGRPMVFLVPDLDQYAGGVRGFLFPFTDSAPGPLLNTTGEVVAALRDLPALQRDNATALKEFNERFNYLMDGNAAERLVERFF